MTDLLRSGALSEKHKMPVVEMPGEHNHESGKGYKDGYRVEVRTSYWSPSVIDGRVIDGVWRTVPIAAGATPWGNNVPVRPWDRDMLDRGLLPMEAAEAHRWTLLAMLDASQIAGSLCIETRLVKVRYHYEYRTEEVGVGDVHKAGSYERNVEQFVPRFQNVEADSSETHNA